MTTKIHDKPAANFATDVIPVEFLVLHYTACSLDEVLKIFSSPEKKVCAHFVIDTDGAIYDMGSFWSGTIFRGAHAGVSSFDLNGKKWEGFNGFSIGIEIVNANGNLIPYPDVQYDSLIFLTRHLISRFPSLKDPNRIVGHEQIAGFRGKSDPGLQFDWGRLFSHCYSTGNFPSRTSILSQTDLSQFIKANGLATYEKIDPSQWILLSKKLEDYVAQLQASKRD